MKFFSRAPSDAMCAVNRCHFEADTGRAAQAVERLRDLDREIPANPHVLYAEGIIRRDCIGQGDAARMRFEEAYQATMATSPGKETAWLAACNAADLAPDEEGCRRWAELAIRHCPKARANDIASQQSHLRNLELCGDYLTFLLAKSEMAAEDGEHGRAAALLEVALSLGTASEDQRLAIHKRRAVSLRACDAAIEKLRNAAAEWFPPDERIALQEALREIDAAIQIDEYDALLWNFRAAWCGLLDRHEEAIQAADRAIDLRPHRYARPHVNKAFSLRKLKRYPEALTSIQEALRHAEEQNSPEEIEQARMLLSEYEAPEPDWTLADLGPHLDQFLSAMTSNAQAEIDQTGQRWNTSPQGVTEMLVGQIFRHASMAGGKTATRLVPILAQLLGDFTSETAFVVSGLVARRAPELGDSLVVAASYLAAHSDGVQRRDAARLLALMILAITADQICPFYRRNVLAISAVADDEMAGLSSLVRNQLHRISPVLPRLIADQEPVGAAERSRAVQDLNRLHSGPPPQPIHSQSRQPQRVDPTGCATMVMVGILIGMFAISPIAARWWHVARHDSRLIPANSLVPGAGPSGLRLAVEAGASPSARQEWHNPLHQAGRYSEPTAARRRWGCAIDAKLGK